MLIYVNFECSYWNHCFLQPPTYKIEVIQQATSFSSKVILKLSFSEAMISEGTPFTVNNGTLLGKGVLSFMLTIDSFFTEHTLSIIIDNGSVLAELALCF